METQPRARIGILKDPVSASTHFAGFVAAIVGLVFLVVLSAHDGAKVVSMAVYGGGLVALFGASSVYHFFDLGVGGNRWLRRLDHSAIFLLIAGSYMPPFFHFLDGAWRIAMISVVGGIAVAGALLKLLWIDSPSWLGLSLYLFLGWVVVVPGYIILPQLSGTELSLLVFGGLAYTVGAVVYASKRPDPWPNVFGHHEVWHLFVLAGALGHFLFAWDLLDRPIPAF
jgi:hemolysin III